MIFKLGWKASLLASVVLSTILFGAGFILLLRLPSYNPYSFQENFGGPLNPAVWELVGSGTKKLGQDGLTLESRTGEVFALRRYLWAQPKWQAPREARILGTVRLMFRLNSHSENASAYVVLETDSVRVGVLGSSLLCQDKRTGRSDAAAEFALGKWYTIEIRNTNTRVEVNMDGSVAWASEGSYVLTWLAVGNLQPTAFEAKVGGSITVSELACLCYPAP